MSRARVNVIVMLFGLFFWVAGDAFAEVTVDNSDGEPSVTWGPSQVYKDWYPSGWHPTWRVSTAYDAKNPYPNTLPSPLPHSSWGNFAQDIPLYSPDSTSTVFFAWAWASTDTSAATLQDPAPWFRWTPTLPAAGWYEVSVCWPASQDYTMEAKYTITSHNPLPKKLTYASSVFRETSADDGSIDNSTPIIITLAGETFTGVNGEDFAHNGKATVMNLPFGLTASIERTSATTVAARLDGQAENHTSAHSITNLTIIFNDTAFAGGDADNVAVSTKANLRIEFNTLYSWFKFDEDAGTTATDSGLLANDGVFICLPEWRPTEGKYNGALYFPGGSNVVNLGQPPVLSFNPSIDSFTISCWFKTTSNGTLISKVNNSSANVQYYILINNNRLGAQSGSGTRIEITTAVNDDKWHLATVVNDATAGVFTLYLDSGDSRVSGTPGTQGDYPRDILIGARRDGNNTSLNHIYTGLIDDVRFYDRALTFDEVRFLYFGEQTEADDLIHTDTMMDQMHLSGGGTGNYDPLPLGDANPLTFTHPSLGTVTYSGRFYSSNEAYSAPSPTTKDDEYNYEAVSTYPTNSTAHTGHYPIFRRDQEPEFMSLGIYYFNETGGYLTLTESDTANTTPGNRFLDARFGQTMQWANSLAADAARWRRVDTPVSGAGPVLVDKNDIFSSDAVILPNFGPRAEYNINLNEYVRGPADGKLPGAYPYTNWYAGRYRVPIADHYRNVNNRTRIHLYPGDLDRISWVDAGDLVEYCFAEYAQSDGVYMVEGKNSADDTLTLTTMIPHECTYWVHNPYGSWRDGNASEFLIFNRKMPAGGLDRIAVTSDNTDFDLSKVTEAFPYLRYNSALYEGDMFPENASDGQALRIRFLRTNTTTQIGRAHV